MSTPRVHPLVLALFAVAFALAYTTQPLYQSNQNTYFLHGLADAGVGELCRDWMANATPAFPLFSAFVTAVAGTGFSVLFVLVHLAFVAAYAFGVIGVLRRAFDVPVPAATLWSAGSLVLLVHARAFRWATEWLPLDVGALAHGGMAEQHLLGEYLEPSTVGVLLVSAVGAGLARRATLAAALAAISAAVHPSYLIPAAFVTAIAMWSNRRAGAAALARAAFAFALLLLPAGVYVWRHFVDGIDPEVARAARDILVNERIPHHARPDVWLGWGTAVQGGLVLAAAGVRSRLRPFFAAGLALTVVGIAAVWVTRDDRLALLFPWRITTVLVPLATAILVMRIAIATRPLPRNVIIGVITFSVAVGSYRIVDRFGPPSGEFHPFAATVSAHVGDPKRALVLVPARGVTKFRLVTGLPVVADWKTHPYRHDEVLAWWERVGAVLAFDAATGPDACAALERLRSAHPISHVVTRERPELECPHIEKLAAHGRYALFEVKS